MYKEGKKNDRKDDKTRWELMPLDCLEDVARVYTEGAKKYGDNNWQNLENGYQRYKAALFRHLCEFEKGIEFDPETGCRHLAQVCWNSLSLLWLSKHSMKDMTVEVWRTAYDYPDYEVSNFGRVRSKDRTIEYSNGKIHELKGKILAQKTDKGGYSTVSLQRDKKNHKVKVHRLVLSTFSESIGEQVNHIDENKSNNHLLNLEWCDCKYNNAYGTKGIRSSINKQKSVIQYKNGEYINTFKSIAEASRVTGIPISNIIMACKKIYKQAGGFTWEYENQNNGREIRSNSKKSGNNPAISRTNISGSK